jgi:beta-1,4-mannosyl-glycoprotein beta-1,4-N-acetylglucosaminyltransferase
MKRLIDCFPYFNEKELLELRYHLLKDYFDFFVVTDADRTHTGDPKPFTAKDTIKELGLDESKFRVVEVKLPSKEEEPDDHVRERMQRNAAAEYITWNTVAFVGDSDEIINPKYIGYYETLVRDNPNNILHVPMVYLMGRADMRDHHPTGETRFWANCYMCMGHHKEKYTLSQLRESYSEQSRYVVYKDIFAIDNGIIEPAGWHFSWMGDPERLKTKFKSFMHYGDFIEDTEFSKQPEKMLEYMDQWKPAEGQPDPLGRHNHILKPYPVEELPQVIFDLPRVKKFLLPDNEE